MGNISLRLKRKKKPSAQCTSTQLSTLNADCLFHLFSYLELPDLLNLRTQCSTLNYVVCKYLPRLTTLKVVLSDSKIEQSNKRKNKSSALKEFVTVSKQEKFIEFVNKYEIRSVKKLTVIMHDNLYFYDLPQLLGLFPRVRKLFLDRTQKCYDSSNPLRLGIEELDCLFESIAKLAFLNALHFFPNKGFHLIRDFSANLDRATISQMFDTFESAIGQKLRIFEKAPRSEEMDLDEILEDNMVQVSGMISNLRNMADDMNREITLHTCDLSLKEYDDYRRRLLSGTCQVQKLLK